MGVGSDDLDVLVVLSDSSGQTSDGATSASTGDECSDLAIGLLPNLFSCAELVGSGVVGVDVLVKDDGARNLLFQSSGDTNVTLGTVVGSLCGGSDDLGTQSLEDGDLLLRHLLRESDDDLVTLDGADEGKTNASVSGGGFDQGGLVGVDAARRLGSFDHAQGDAILDTAASIEELKLCVDGGLETERLGDLVQTNEGGVADLLGDGRHDDRGVSGV